MNAYVGSMTDREILSIINQTGEHWMFLRILPWFFSVSFINSVVQPPSNLLAGLTDLLTFVDALASNEDASENSRSFFWNSPPTQPFDVFLAYGKAYDRGIISCQKLLDVLVAPFVKLGRKAINLCGTSNEGALDWLTHYWGAIAISVLTGIPIEVNVEEARVLAPVMVPQKRSELVKEMVKAKLEEVCQCLCSPNKNCS